MVQADFTTLRAWLAEGRVDVQGVGAFWQQARRIRVPGARQPVAVVPVTFHLTGEIRSVAYAQLLVGPGLREASESPSRSALIWHSRAGKTPPLAFSEFAMPPLNLFWSGSADADAQALGARLLEILAQEFPHPEWELERAFGSDLERIFVRLAETEYREAGATLRSTHD